MKRVEWRRTASYSEIGSSSVCLQLGFQHSQRKVAVEAPTTVAASIVSLTRRNTDSFSARRSSSVSESGGSTNRWLPEPGIAKPTDVFFPALARPGRSHASCECCFAGARHGVVTDPGMVVRALHPRHVVRFWPSARLRATTVRTDRKEPRWIAKP